MNCVFGLLKFLKIKMLWDAKIKKMHMKYYYETETWLWNKQCIPRHIKTEI